MWKWRGARRPEFAVEPGPGQESVWDYPRPPEIAATASEVVVRDGTRPVAQTRAALRVLETASPPTYYLPLTDIVSDALVEIPGSSTCEWKGRAYYCALAWRPEVPVAWGYRKPRADFAALQDHLAFYPGRVACFVDAERVRAQAGGFYGGWITAQVVGPFKGDPGTGHW